MTLAPRLAVGAWTAALLAAPSTADQLWTVGVNPGVYDFTVLQDAIDAAADGDTIFLFPKAYQPAVIDGKGIAIVAPKGSLVSILNLTIRNLPVGRSVELRDIEFDPLVTEDSLVIEDCAGTVTLDSCRSVFTQGHGLVARNAARVIASDCRFVGEDGESLSPFTKVSTSGFPGLLLDNATAHLVGSDCIGGDGAWGSSALDSTAGGPGARLLNGSFLSMDGCVVRGGVGGVYGDLFTACQTVGGGNGIAADPSCSVHERDSIVIGGSGDVSLIFPTGIVCTGPDGVDYEGLSPLIVPGATRPFDVPGVLFESVTADLEFRAEPGDLGILVAGLAPSPLYAILCGGIAMTANQPTLVVLPPLDANGDLDFPFSPGPFPLGFEVEQVFLQSVFIEPAGTCKLGAPRVPTLLRCIPLPGESDCNNNGLRDFCDIAATLGSDLNGNNILDECE